MQIRRTPISSAPSSDGFEPNPATIAVQHPAHDGPVPSVVRIEAEPKMLSHALKHGVVVGPEAPHSTESEVDDAAEEPERAQEVDDHGYHETQPCMKQSVEIAPNKIFQNRWVASVSAPQSAGDGGVHQDDWWAMEKQVQHPSHSTVNVSSIPVYIVGIHRFKPSLVSRGWNWAETIKIHCR